MGFSTAFGKELLMKQFDFDFEGLADILQIILWPFYLIGLIFAPFFGLFY